MSFPSQINQFVLQNAPLKLVNPKLGESDSTWKLTTRDLSEALIKDGQVVVKLILLSNDPTQRTWIQKGIDASRMYVKPVEEGEPMRSLGLGEIVFSKNDNYKVGEKVNGVFAWGDYAVAGPEQLFNKVNELFGLPLTAFQSAVGMTGMTAYFGTTKIGQLQKGQSIIVSAASGATGLMVVQIAKHIVGASKVIGIAGSDDKCRWVESLGADVCINYKSGNLKQELEKALGGEYVDVYYDNVGGEQLDLCLSKVKPFGRVVACGAIAGYNDHLKMWVKAWNEIIVNRLTVQGFIVLDFVSEWGDAAPVLLKAIKEGKVKMDGVTVVDVEGDLKKVPEVWMKLFADKGPGKLITKL